MYFQFLFYIFKINKIIILLLSIYMIINFSFIIFENNKISIIIPTYNRQNFVIKSLKNILNQTYKNIEVLIVDDGSSDNTKEKIKIIKDNRIRYIKLKKNKGACFARNIGIKKSTGKYISFQDSDDLSYFDKLEKQFKNLLKYNSDFDFCKLKLYRFKNNNYSIIPYNYQCKQILNNNILNEICKGNFISTSSILIKKKFIIKYLFDNNIPRLQDYDLMLRMIPNAKISFTNKVLINLYVHNDSISYSKEKLKKAINILLNKKYKLNSIQKKYLIININEIIKKLNKSF